MITPRMEVQILDLTGEEDEEKDRKSLVIFITLFFVVVCVLAFTFTLGIFVGFLVGGGGRFCVGFGVLIGLGVGTGVVGFDVGAGVVGAGVGLDVGNLVGIFDGIALGFVEG